MAQTQDETTAYLSSLEEEWFQKQYPVVMNRIGQSLWGDFVLALKKTGNGKRGRNENPFRILAEQALILQFLKKEKVQYPNLRGPKILLNGATEGFRAQYEETLLAHSKGSDLWQEYFTQIDDLFPIVCARIESMETDDEIAQMMMHWFRQGDTVSSYKAVGYCSGPQIGGHQLSLVKNSLNAACGGKIGQVSGRMRKCVDDRNEIEHEKNDEDKKGKLTLSLSLTRLDRLRSAANAFVEHEDTASLDSALSFLDSVKERVSASPVTLDEIAARYPDCTQDEIRTVLDAYLDDPELYDGTSLHLVSDRMIERSVSGILRLTQTQRAKVVDLQQQLVKVRQGRMEPSQSGLTERSRKEALSVSVAANPIASLAGFAGGALQDKQLNELLSKSIVLATPAFWSEKAGRAFLSGKVRQELYRYGRKLLMDDGTRMYFRNAADQEKKKPAAQQDEELLRADSQRREMYRMGILDYLPGLVSGPVTSREWILYLAEHYAHLRFCIFMTGKDLGLIMDLIRSGAQNVIPVLMEVSGPIGDSRAKINMQPAALGDMIRQAAGDTQTVLQEEEMPDDTADAFFLQEEEEPARESDETQPAPEPEAEKGPRIQDCVYRPCGSIPQTGSVLMRPDGIRVTLKEQIGLGGEAAVYRTDTAGQATKIYREGHGTRERYDKIRYMITHAPADPRFAWPKEILFDKDGGFAGFLMPCLPDGTRTFQTTVMALSKPEKRNGTMKGWGREAVARLAADVCEALSGLPQDVLMGDINPNNFLLDTTVIPTKKEQARFWIVDCDSFQVGDWRCEVGTTEFTSPRIYREYGTNPVFGTFKRTVEDEQFAVATLLFKMLMLGELPYSSVHGSFGPESILAQEFEYRYRDESGEMTGTGKDVPDGPFRILWNNLDPALRSLFGQSFQKDAAGPPAVAQWIRPLRGYAARISRGQADDTLMPELYFDPEGAWTKRFTCSLCGQERNMPKNRYDALTNDGKNRHPLLLCGSCQTQRKKLKALPDTFEIRCPECGSTRMADLFESWEIENGYRSRRCDECRQTVTRTCVSCGAQITKQKYLFDRQEKAGRPIRCDECRKQITRTCAECGKEVTGAKYYLDEIEKSGRRILCEDCRGRYRRRR